MPFSRSRTWTASTISLDIRSPLQQVAAIDVGVGDRDDPRVGGDGDLAVTRTDQLAREAPAAAHILARAHARATTDEAAVVVRLRQRPLGTGRGDLKPRFEEQVAQVVGYPLAHLEIHSRRMIDHEPQGARVRLLE